MRVIVLLAVLLSGCAQAGSRAIVPVNDDIISRPFEKAETPLATQPLRPRRLSLGEVLYLRQCADCHGWEARGDGPLAAVLAAKPTNLRQQTALFSDNTDAQIVTRILYGTPLAVRSPEAFPYSDADVGALITHLRRFPTMQWGEVQRGKGVYDSLCAACHGLYGRGDGLAARSIPTRMPDFTDSTYQQSVTEDTLTDVVSNGKGAMPGTGDVLTAHEIRSVVTFLRVLSPGYELYGRFCAHCHGNNGVPSVAPAKSSTSKISQKVPVRLDETYLRTHTAEEIRTAVQHMGRHPRPTMPHLAHQLTAEDTQEIVRYLRMTLTP